MQKSVNSPALRNMVAEWLYWGGAGVTLGYYSYHNAQQTSGLKKYDWAEMLFATVLWPLGLPVLIGKRLGTQKLKEELAPKK